jgi:hypothetical protein
MSTVENDPPYSGIIKGECTKRNFGMSSGRTISGITPDYLNYIKVCVWTEAALSGHLIL